MAVGENDPVVDVKVTFCEAEGMLKLADDPVVEKMVLDSPGTEELGMVVVVGVERLGVDVLEIG